MRRLFAAFGAVLLLTQGLAAQDRDEATGLRELMTAYEASGWEAVGLISIGAGGMCTGALIETNVVLTAAHCLFDARDGSRIDPGKVKFHAGWRNGRSTASRNVRRAIVHPDYVFTGPNGDLHVANDIALLELESEIRLSNITPYATGNRPRKGQNVGVVSYAHDRASSPSLQRVCYVLARQIGTLILSCEVDFGLREHLAEFGLVAAKGRENVDKLRAALEPGHEGLENFPPAVRHMAQLCFDQIDDLSRRISELDAQILAASKQSSFSSRLQKMPGIGPITSMALAAFAPPMESFRRGRDFSAWLGLVPRQHSSGGKQRLGRTSKSGQRDIRRLLILGAMAVIE